MCVRINDLGLRKMVVQCDVSKIFIINTILFYKFMNDVNMWFKECRTHGTTIFSQDA
jgi:hypothetical protein